MPHAVTALFLILSSCFVSLASPILPICLAADVEGRIPQAVVTFLDAGEGDSILLQSRGKHALIDVGNPLSGHSVLSQLEASGVKELEALILTHPHPDHFGGIFEVLPRLKVQHLYDNGEPLSRAMQGEPVLRWYSELVRNHARYQVLVPQDKIQIGGLELTVLSSFHSRKSPDWNTNSLVIMARAGSFRLLLMGDGNAETERSLIDGGVDISASVLKAGHHGAADTGTADFLNAVGPTMTVISVNRDNRNGYPSHDALQRIRKVSRIYRTDRDGAITLSIFDNGAYTVSKAGVGGGSF